MFLRLPPRRHRNNVYLYVKSNNSYPTSSAGNEDSISVRQCAENISQLQNISEENKLLRDRYSKVYDQLADLRKEFLENSELLKAFQKVGIPSTDLENKIIELSASKSSEYECRIKVVDLQNALEKMKEKFTEKMEQYREKKSDVASSSMNSVTIDNEKENKIKNLENSLKTSNIRIQETEGRIEGLLEQIDQLKLNTRILEEEKEALIAENNAKVEDKTKMKKISDKVSQEYFHIKQQYDECNNRIQSIQLSRTLEASKFQEQLDNIRKEYLEGYDENLASQIAAYKQKSITDAKELERLNALSNKLQNEMIELNRINESYAKEINSSQFRETQISTQIIEKTNLVTHLQNQNDILKANYDELSASFTKLKENIKVHKEVVNDICERSQQDITDLSLYCERQLEIFTKLSNTLVFKKSTSFDKISHIFEDVASLLHKSAEINWDNLSCNDIQELYAAFLFIHTQLVPIESVLTNLYEDLAGGVRVYIRIRPKATDAASTSSVVKLGQTVEYYGDLCGGSNFSFGRFFGVIPDNFKNADVYSGCIGTTISDDLKITGHQIDQELSSKCCLLNDASGLCRVINQIKDGYHVILFGYGYSGSGKTKTIYGDNLEPGIAQLAIANSGANKINLLHVFEQYYHSIDFRAKNFNSGKFIKLFTHSKATKSKKLNLFENTPTMHVSEEDLFERYYPAVSDLKSRSINPIDFSILRANLDAFRYSRDRIKATPNNPQSSRSHLFAVLEFEYSNGTTGYMTVIDMGGRESSVEVLEMFLTKPEERPWQLTSMLMDLKLIPKYIKPHIFTPTDTSISWMYNNELFNTDGEYKASFLSYIEALNAISQNMDRVMSVVKESVFINETLNGLVHYFKNIQKISDKRESNHLPTNAYDEGKFLTGKPTLQQDRMGMFSILHTLGNLVGKTKYVMLCTVYQDSYPDKLCKSTGKTLQFAHEIRST